MRLQSNALATCSELAAYIDEVSFLPLLPLSRSGCYGWSADEAVAPQCRYVLLPGGGWQWKLWEWKGQLIQETGCAYGRFFDNRAAFVSRAWWPHLCNWRRSCLPRPAEGSIEEAILFMLREHGSLINKDLRRLCGFTGTGVRGKFDAYVTRLQMAGYVVTEDFVYPRDKHGHEYGWGWSRYTTPEERFGHAACHPDATPEASHAALLEHFARLLPSATSRTLEALLK